MELKVELGNKQDMEWAQETAVSRHYLHSKADPRSRPMAYIVWHGRRRVGLGIVGIPHATKNGGWWGYPGLPTQWQVIDLCRIWLDPAIQHGGELAQTGVVPGFTDRRGIFRPTVATWLIHQVLERVQRDRISLWPPVFLKQPYHILLAISYHDPAHHRGTIYREAGAVPMYTDEMGTAVAGSSGKVGWCWRLPQPTWSWESIEIAKPRTLRFSFC